MFSQYNLRKKYPQIQGILPVQSPDSLPEKHLRIMDLHSLVRENFWSAEIFKKNKAICWKSVPFLGIFFGFVVLLG